MEESNHPLGFTVLEIRDTVAGYENLSEETIQRLMDAEDLSPLTPDMQRRVLGQMIPSPSWLTVEIDGTAVLVTNQWVVSIHGDSLAHCVVALVKYRNAIEQVLGTAVKGEIQSPIAENTGPLHEVVRRREREGRFKDKISKFRWELAWAAAGAVMGSALTILVSMLVGG